MTNNRRYQNLKRFTRPFNAMHKSRSKVSKNLIENFQTFHIP